MRAIVTGSSGFIGHDLGLELLKSNSEVLGVDPIDSGTIVTHTTKIQEYDRDHKDRRGTAEILIDYVFHFGSPSSQVLFKDFPMEQTIETLSGLDAAVSLVARINHLKFNSKTQNWRDSDRKTILTQTKLVVPSTSSLYGVKNDYAFAKELVEHFCNIQEESISIPRIFAGYGPREGHKGEYASVIYQWCKAAVEHKEITIFRDGSQSRDFIYIDDIVDNVIEGRDRSGIWDLGTGVSTSFNEVIEIIQSQVGYRLKVKYVDKPTNYLESTKCESPISNPTSIEKGISKILMTMK